MKVSILSLLFLEAGVAAFQPAAFGRREQVASFISASRPTRRPLKASEEEGDLETNNYQDENYPDLEFIDYDDPNYVVDQGVGNEFFSTTDEETEVKIEAMREDRRRRNDEFQFETYFSKILKSGDEYFGEWTVYKTSTFIDGVSDEEAGQPRFVRARQPIKVKSRAYKIKVQHESEFRVDGERICHEEIQILADGEKVSVQQRCRLFVNQSNPKYRQALEVEAEIMANTYWPNELKAYDFRGTQGIMCVGSSHTIASGVSLVDGLEKFEGPFSEMKAEVGISDNDLRMRVKLAYSVKDDDKQAFEKNPESTPPSLHLKSMTVCRETKGKWPINGMGESVSETDLVESEILFGIPGAVGGLYDPPPVGGDAQAGQYMMLDLEGGATVFFPYLMQQEAEAFNGFGWATSLDWSPGAIRFQVDRKVKAGAGLLGLRTLELSEVQGKQADTYRPRDGGSNMRQ
jgi:hypothetical protein